MTISIENQNLTSIQEQIKALQAQADEIISAKRTEVIASIRQKMNEYQLSFSDIATKEKPDSFGAKTRGASANPAPAKFRGPKGEAWSGRGLKPLWLKAEIASGKTQEQFLIEPVAA